MSTVLDEILSGEADQEAEASIQHPRLGYGRIVGEPGEMETMETDELGYEFEGGGGGTGLIKHPRLGIGRVVPRGAAHELEDQEAEIIGADTRNLVSATTAVPYRWICCLDLYFPDPDNSSKEIFFRGSGTLISPKHVLTCGHCLFDEVKGSRGTWRKVQVRRIVARPARSGPTTAPFGSANSTAVKFNSAWRSSQDPQSDFGVITLNKALGSTKFASLGNKPLGWWGDPTNGVGTRVLPTLEPSRMQGSLINVSGYPGDKCNTQPANGSATRAQLEACPTNSWASAQWHSTGNCTTPAAAGQPRLMRYTNDTFGGHSGSPVWLRWQTTRWLIAVHHAGSGGGGYNEGVRVTPELWNQVRAWM